jgi:S-layer family protein
MKKKITLLTVILVLIFSFSASAAEINFTDVKTDDWFYKNLQELTEKNIISGYMDSTFKPGNTLKFEEFIKMLVVAVEEELVSQKGEHEWYQTYIDKAIESKYITEQQKLLIGLNIDRATMAEILYNVLSNTKGVEQFDTDKIEYLKTLFLDLSTDDIKTLTIAGMGLICGYPDGTYKPNDSLKRSETVAVISRLLDKDQRLPVDFTKMDDVVVTPPSDITLDELPNVDLSHLYDYPTLLGSTVKAENISNNKWVNTDVIAADYIDYMELTHNRDYTTISKKATQYKQDLLYYLNGYKEYRGKKYYLLRKNELEYYTSSNNQEMIDYVLSKDDYIEFFLDKWVQDTINNKVKVQAKFYTSDDLVIKADGTIAVRGTLRIKYDSNNNPSNIKEELDLVKRETVDSGRGFLNLPESNYDIYMKYNDIPDFEVNKWYEIDMDLVVVNRALIKGLEEKASHSYEYIYPIEVRELNL